MAAILMAAVLLLLASLTVDLGLARDTKAASQNGADASSLAAANALYLNSASPLFTNAVAAAKSYADVNYGVKPTDWSTCTDPSPLAYTPDAPNTCISFDQAVKPSKVRVLMPIRRVNAAFSGLAGGANIPVRSAARANIVANLTQPCGLCVLGSGQTHNFQNGDAVVNGADIYLNGNSDVSNNGLIASSGAIYVEGTASGGLGQYSPDPTTGVPAISDPLAGVALPPDMTGLQNRTDPCTQGPGIYVGWSVQNSTCVLQPGLYVVTSGTVNLAGNSAGILKGTGVTIYLTCATGTAPRVCNTGESGARFDASGSGSVQITAPTSGPLKGVAIVADRTSVDPGSNQPLIELTGNGTLGMTGAVYAASATLRMNGNGCTNGINSMIVVKDIKFNGTNSCITVNYSVDQNPDPPPGVINLDQ